MAPRLLLIRAQSMMQFCSFEKRGAAASFAARGHAVHVVEIARRDRWGLLH